MTTPNQLLWKEEYSVKVKEIDEQHKILFLTINNLIKEINTMPSQEKVKEIVGEIVKYKSDHFATEEKYFKLFNYEEAELHIQAHAQFASSLQELIKKFGDDTIGFSFALVDFLENWLIDHLMNMDHRYIKCFTEHGLT